MGTRQENVTNSEPEPDGVINKFGGDCTDRRLMVPVDSLIAGEHRLVETIIDCWSLICWYYKPVF